MQLLLIKIVSSLNYEVWLKVKLLGPTDMTWPYKSRIRPKRGKMAIFKRRE